MAENDEIVFDPREKKKKSKPKADIVDEQPLSDTEEAVFDPHGKKKKKKIKALPEGDDELTGDVKKPTIDDSNLIDAKSDWPDYTYDELLYLVFGIMREKNPELAAGEKKKFLVLPPQVARAGSKKTAFANFAEITRVLKRQPKHVLQFLLAELGTTGSIDGNDCLIMKGRFQQKHIESILRKYIHEYVTCHTCRSTETQLTKDTRLFFLQCTVCGSRCSVTAIKSGFTAMVGKRAAARRQAEATAGK